MTSKGNKKISACILSVGDELTSGQSLDTNSAWIARQLGLCGIETTSHTTVSDDQPLIANSILQLAVKADIVIVTGGLGPTPDDLTRQALAQAMDAELTLDQKSLDEIEKFFRSRNYPMAANNRIQAMIPAGAAAMANTNGTAPGITATLENATVYVTPGVPREMRIMFENQILPKLPRGVGVISHHVVKTYGGGESAVAAELEDLLTRSGPVVAGTTVADGLVSVRITSHAADIETADTQAGNVVEKICERLGTLVLGVGEDVTMAGAIGELLRRAGQTLATAESCTGGMIGAMLTSIGGASEYYRGGVVAYANEIKQHILGVDAAVLETHGAVSEQVSGAMAIGVCEKFGTDWGIGITGVAGPTGGSPEKPLGLVYTSLCKPGGEVTVKKHTLGDHNPREIIRQRASLAALNALRLELLAARES
ncbi:MAG: competence/damage-inducible protein A [Phycisphaerae bacterium]|nr:competence/damage-inducible protein A [Phycisphaerae bacterium]